MVSPTAMPQALGGRILKFIPLIYRQWLSTERGIQIPSEYALPTAAARTVGARVLLDACQSVPHMPIDVAVRGGLDWRFFLVSRGEHCGRGVDVLCGKKGYVN